MLIFRKALLKTVKDNVFRFLEKDNLLLFLEKNIFKLSMKRFIQNKFAFRGFYTDELIEVKIYGTFNINGELFIDYYTTEQKAIKITTMKRPNEVFNIFNKGEIKNA